MLIFHCADGYRIYLTHHVAAQLPADFAKRFYDVAADFQQTNDATIFFIPFQRRIKFWHLIGLRFPRRFMIIVQR